MLETGKLYQDGMGGRTFCKNGQFLIYPIRSPRSISDASVPEVVRTDFNEAAAVLPISPKASAALSRRVLQYILREEFKCAKKDLIDQIAEFVAVPGRPSGVTQALEGIRHFGNFSAHPMKDKATGEIIEVEEGEAEWLLDILEALFDFAYIQPARLKKQKDELNKKLKAAGKKEMQ